MNRPKALFLVPLLLLANVEASTGIEPATVSGRITDAQTDAPISGATVVVSIGTNWSQTETTDSDGHYSMEVTMYSDPQTVFIEAAGPDHLPARLGGAPNQECYFGCAGTGAVELIAGQVLADQDLALTAGGGRFSGTVTSASGGQPIANVRIEPLLKVDGSFWNLHMEFSATTDQNGQFEMPLALEAGEYFVLARSMQQNFVTAALGDVPCPGRTCPILTTDTVLISDGNVLPDVDLELKTGATLSMTAEPTDIDRIIRLYNAAGQMLDQTVLFAGQPDWQRARLPGASYFLEIGPSGQSTYMRQLHNGLHCPFSGCERASGPAIELAQGSAPPPIEINLQEGGQLAGRLVDQDSGLPPEPAQPDGRISFFNVFDSAGQVFGGGAIDVEDDDIVLRSFTAIPPGDYYVRTFNSFSGEGIGTAIGRTNSLPGYADAAFPDVSCAGVACDLDQAQAVSIVQGETTDIEIEVARGSRITGTVVDDSSGAALANAIVNIVDAQNNRLMAIWADEDGAFNLGTLPAGTYYLRTAMSSRLGVAGNPVAYPYFDRVHGAAEPCTEQLCVPGEGTAIELDGIEDAGPFELRVVEGPIISGRIIDQITGATIARGQVEIRNEADQLVGRYAISTLDARFRSTALPPGTYTVIPRVSPVFQPVLPSPASPEQAAATRSTGRTNPSPQGFQVVMESESVETELRVIDIGADRVFRSGFINLPFGQ